MLNPYSIILGLFTAAGLGTMLWGWIIIARARKTRDWPHIEGRIDSSHVHAEDDALLPDIRFHYQVDGRDYQTAMEFSADTSPTREFSEDYVRRFPPGATVKVYYNPEQPDQATLEPGLRPGDGMVFGFGLGITVLMVLMLLFDH